MRIITGKFKGFNLKSPKSSKIRPTAGKVREALFAILRFRLAGSRVLDLFAGSGSLGLEALSEGAESITFVDNSYKSIRLLNENCQDLEVESETKIIKSKVSAYLKSVTGEKFDIIFLDPPYKSELASKTINLILENNILASDGVVISETSSQENIDTYAGKIEREETYGGTKLTFVKYKN